MTWKFNEWVQRCQWLSTTVTSLCPAYPIKEIGTLQLVQCKVFTKMYIILQFHNVYNILIFLLPIITDLPPVCLLHWQPPWCSLNWRGKKWRQLMYVSFFAININYSVINTKNKMMCCSCLAWSYWSLYSRVQRKSVLLLAIWADCTYKHALAHLKSFPLAGN